MHRFALIVVGLVGSTLLSACETGSVSWAPPADCATQPAGTPCVAEIRLRPGSTGQVTLALEATGSMAGTFNVTATASRADRFTATVAPAAIQARDGASATTTVTVQAASSAIASDDGTIVVEAMNAVGGFSKTTVRARIESD
ncbi:MAG: hypothetical protein QM765_34615 [Myxococcales bacterium]